MPDKIIIINTPKSIEEIVALEQTINIDELIANGYHYKDSINSGGMYTNGKRNIIVGPPDINGTRKVLFTWKKKPNQQQELY